MRRIPLALTLSRIPMAVLVWAAPGNPPWMFGLMIAAGLTDALDGFLARRIGGTSPSGAWLDPLCDKIFVLSALAGVAWSVRPPAWALALVAARELVQVPMALVVRARGLHRHFDYRAALVGKLATAAQFAAVAALLLRHPSALPLCAAAGLSGLAAAIHYARRAARLSA